MVEGYCVKCKKKQEMFQPEECESKNGMIMMKGSCPVCSTTMCRIVGKKK